MLKARPSLHGLTMTIFTIFTPSIVIQLGSVHGLTPFSDSLGPLESSQDIKTFLDITESQFWIAYPKVGLEEQAALRRTVGFNFQHLDLVWPPEHVSHGVTYRSTS